VKDDFDFIEKYEIYSTLFYDVFYGFIKSKLDALRTEIHKSKGYNEING